MMQLDRDAQSSSRGGNPIRCLGCSEQSTRRCYLLQQRLPEASADGGSRIARLLTLVLDAVGEEARRRLNLAAAQGSERQEGGRRGKEVRGCITGC